MQTNNKMQHSFDSSVWQIFKREKRKFGKENFRKRDVYKFNYAMCVNDLRGRWRRWRSSKARRNWGKLKNCYLSHHCDRESLRCHCGFCIYLPVGGRNRPHMKCSQQKFKSIHEGYPLFHDHTKHGGSKEKDGWYAISAHWEFIVI